MSACTRCQQYALPDQHAIERSADKAHCVSHIAVVPKRNNKYPLMHNLRQVRVVDDSFCKVTFQCENIKTVAQLIEPKDDLVTVDIKKRVPPHQKPLTLHLLAIKLLVMLLEGRHPVTLPV